MGPLKTDVCKLSPPPPYPDLGLGALTTEQVCCFWFHPGPMLQNSTAGTLHSWLFQVEGKQVVLSTCRHKRTRTLVQRVSLRLPTGRVSWSPQPRGVVLSL